MQKLTPDVPSAGSMTDEVAALRDIGADFHRRGWSLATSSNYSVVVRRQPLLLLMTASGKDKGKLNDSDFILIDAQGKPAEDVGRRNGNRPSAEAMLHVVAARFGAGAVLHTHSLSSTLLSDICFERGFVELSGLEMLKALDGVTTHETTVRMPIFDNTQDIDDLARRVSDRQRDSTASMQYGFLLRNHGLYTWGKSLADARRHVEALEFMFELTIRSRSA